MTPVDSHIDFDIMLNGKKTNIRLSTVIFEYIFEHLKKVKYLRYKNIIITQDCDGVLYFEVEDGKKI